MIISYLQKEGPSGGISFRRLSAGLYEVVVLELFFLDIAVWGDILLTFGFHNFAKANFIKILDKSLIDFLSNLLRYQKVEGTHLRLCYRLIG